MIHRFVRIGVLAVTSYMFMVACGDFPQTAKQQGASSNPSAVSGDANATNAVRFGVSPNNTFTELQTTLTVPAQPPADGTLFIWPGLQPGGADYAPIGNGVLQPVLTWGPSCAPGTVGNDHSTWWISSEYVNLGNDAGYEGCQGGNRVAVAPGDTLNIDMALTDTTWTQTVQAPQGTVTFTKDLQGQSQNYAYFVIEEGGQKPVSDVLFENTTLRFAEAAPDACQPQQAEARDFVGSPTPGTDGQSCVIPRLILRADGVAQTLYN